MPDFFYVAWHDSSGRQEQIDCCVDVTLATHLTKRLNAMHMAIAGTEVTVDLPKLKAADSGRVQKEQGLLADMAPFWQRNGSRKIRLSEIDQAPKKRTP